MPYETKLEGNGTVVVTNYYGTVTPSELYAAVIERFADSEKNKKYRAIIADFTDVTEAIYENLDVELPAELFKKMKPHLENIIYIAIMPSDMLFGMGRMWDGMHSYDLSLNTNIVRSRNEADALLESYFDKE